MGSNFFKTILYPFMLLSAVGLILSVVVHGSALLGIDLGFGKNTYILHFGIFIVWLPAILAANRFAAFNKFKPKDYWKIVLSGSPPWMRKMVMVFFVYAMVNFVLTAIQGMEKDELTKLRGFSGHWMAFYAAAFAMIYSVREKWDTMGKILKCPNGHEVSVTSKFCEACGVPLNEEK